MTLQKFTTKLHNAIEMKYRYELCFKSFVLIIENENYNDYKKPRVGYYMVWISLMEPPKGGTKSRFHAGFSHKSRQEIAWNSCLSQVYPITLNAMLIFHAITPIFTSNSRFRALQYVQSRHHAFPLGGPDKILTK